VEPQNIFEILHASHKMGYFGMPTLPVDYSENVLLVFLFTAVCLTDVVIL